MHFFRPARTKWPALAVVRLSESGVAFQLNDKIVVGLGLFPRQINIETQQWNQADDRHVVGCGHDVPQLPPIHIGLLPLVFYSLLARRLWAASRLVSLCSKHHRRRP